MTDPDARQVDDRYAQVMGRLSVTMAAGALAIYALTALSVHDKPRSLWWVGGNLLCSVPFNAWISSVLLKRWGASAAESMRMVVNLLLALVQNHAIGWPLPVWLWLPYVAITFDGFRRRTMWAVLTLSCVVSGAVAVGDGVSWLYPVVFSAFALVCRVVTEARLSVMRDMFVRSEEQRRSLDEAHASLQSTHDQLTTEVRARERAELELRQSQKLEAVGRLAAGVAHEINTPLQFVSDSVHFLDEGSTALFDLLGEYRRIFRLAEEGAPAADVAGAVAQAEEDSDVAYLVENVPKSMLRVRDGLTRVANIVRAMKEFAYPDRKEVSPLDVNRAIRGTLTISAHEYKQVADVDLQEGDLPPIECYASEINQVFLNLVVNAAHAVGDVVKDGARGRITIRTAAGHDEVVVTIADTGGGIPKEIQSHIFEPFFTTKEVGKGTGQGLAIARSVVQRHGGTLTFESEVDRGTTFTIRLPTAPKRRPQERAA